MSEGVIILLRYAMPRKHQKTHPKTQGRPATRRPITIEEHYRKIGISAVEASTPYVRTAKK
jgi:hypothetical protein